MNRTVARIAREEQETVIVAGFDSVDVSTTVPAHWRAIKRRAAKLGGTIQWIDVFQTKAGKRYELGGSVSFPSGAFSQARFGIRSSPKKAK